MKKIEYWAAEDGAQFDSEEECFLYELNQMYIAADKKLIFFDEKRNIIENGYFWEKLEEAVYIFVGNEKALELIKRIGAEYGIAAPNDVGFWKYQYEPYEHYISLATELIKLKEEVKFIETFIKLIPIEKVKQYVDTLESAHKKDWKDTMIV